MQYAMYDGVVEELGCWLGMTCEISVHANDYVSYWADMSQPIDSVYSDHRFRISFSLCDFGKEWAID